MLFTFMEKLIKKNLILFTSSFKPAISSLFCTGTIKKGHTMNRAALIIYRGIWIFNNNLQLIFYKFNPAGLTS